MLNKIFGAGRSSMMITLGFTAVICVVLALMTFSLIKTGVMEDLIHDTTAISETILLNNKIVVNSAVDSGAASLPATLAKLDDNRRLLVKTVAMNTDADNELHTIRYELIGFTLLIVLSTIIIAVVIRKQVNEYEMALAAERDHNMVLAGRDPLTGMTNRFGFERNLNMIIEDGGNTSVLMYLDLDQFKIVNDTCGHMAGDQLLKQLAVELRAVINAPDVIARIGGDEFAIILKDCSMVNAHKVAERVRRVIEDYRFVYDDKLFSVSVSIGMTQIDAKHKTAHETLIEADVACYSAKDHGRNKVHVYDGEHAHIDRVGEIQEVHKINRALEENLFEVYYQKMVDIKTGQHAKFEVLIRRKDPVTGKIDPPGSFLPAAERYGKMPLIDRWVISNALNIRDSICNSCGVDACDPGLRFEENMIFINLSGASINDETFLDFVKEAVRLSHIQPPQICFEITETVAISNMESAVNFMHELRKLGCKFALDDFGSGMSSFTYLKNLPIDFIKINGSIVRNITTDKVEHEMLKSIISISKVMGVQSIAEYVENKEVLDELKNLHVDFAQGYFIHKPAPFKKQNCDVQKIKNIPIITI